MILAEYFTFLPFGKYAFYIWSSYLIGFAVIAILFIRTYSLRKKIHQQLRAKYERGSK